MNYFKPPEIKTQFDFISLGAGVQSSTMALMAAKGLIAPMPQAAIFADTQAEPKSVYAWLEWLVKQLPFPTHIVTKGNLATDAGRIRKRKSGEGYWIKSLIPAFVKNKDGSTGIIQRQCTADYKLSPLIKKQRQLASIKRGQKEKTVTVWIGISWDEIRRMKDAREPWTQNRYPLVEMRMTRKHCLDWMRDNGYPTPPRSACVFCPFHSDAEWRRLKTQEPDEFRKAVELDYKYREVKQKCNNMKGEPYLHNSLLPLDQVDFSTDVERGQLTLWDNECEGMCGV